MTSRIGLKPKNKSSWAFTLIEVLLVLVVMSVLVGISVPNFRNTYQKFFFKKSVEDLAYTMRYAQSRAIMKNLIVRLEFNGDFTGYWLTQQKKSDSEEAAPTFSKIDGEMGKDFKVGSDVKIEAPEPAVNFYPDGNIDKQEIKVCLKEDCYAVVTNQQRGYVNFFPTDAH